MELSPADEIEIGESLRRHKADGDLMAAMDDVLIGLTDGRLDQAAMRKLPPWRAVLLARVAVKCWLMPALQCEVMVRSAAHVGGNGVLGAEVWTDLDPSSATR